MSVRTHNSRLWRGIAAAVAISALAACSDDLGASRLKSLPKGAKREAVLSAMGSGPLTAVAERDAQRVVGGFRRQTFITRARVIEVLWYREQPGTLDDRITRETETPVVVEADTLVGWGWKFYSPFADSMKLPDPVRDSIRLDSIYRAQKGGK